jgi:hypothetical protein
MATTIRITDVQTDSDRGLITILVDFDADGHKWTQGFNIVPAATSYMKTAAEYIDLVKTILTAHATEVVTSLKDLDVKGNWKFADALKGLTFTTAK